MTLKSATELIEEIIGLTDRLPPDKLKELDEAILRETGHLKFVPNPGPQHEAYFTPADITFYGGAGGGGKTRLLCGLAVNEHHDVHLFRREATQIRGLIKELTEIIGSTSGLNRHFGIWTLAGGKTIEVAGIKDEADKEKWQGRAADLKGFDEITHFSRSQFQFIIGWNRTTRPGQRCRVVATGNPPMTADGLWVIQYWAPWIDDTYHDPAEPCELRWAVRRSDDSPDTDELFFRSIEEAMGHLATLSTAPRDHRGNLIPPRSRTFIPAALEDNPELMRTGYMAVLDAMPKELRDAMRHGKFSASLRDNPHQLIPTAWIMAAQERWEEDGWKKFGSMTAMAFDPAGGGRDDAVLGWRYGGWYAPLVSEQGVQTADGSAAAAKIIQHRRNNAPVVVDAGGGAGHGFGGTTIMRLKDNNVIVRAFNGAAESMGKTRDKIFRFANKRAEAWWRFREALDPDQEGGSPVDLPPDPELRADLASPTFEATARGILVEDKRKIRERLGRSPGKGDAVVMCYSEGSVAVQRMLNNSSMMGRGGLTQSVNPDRSRYTRHRRGAHPYQSSSGGGEQG
jgi:hypothetical protein